MTTPEATSATPFTSFSPRGYLNEYYSRVEGENDQLLAFHARAHASLGPAGTMLEFGGGPTVYQLISAAAHVEHIDFSDYLPENVYQARTWRDALSGSFDWTPFIARALELEGLACCADSIAARESLLRQRLKGMLLADAFQAEPLGHPALYDRVAVNFVAESITSDHESWLGALTNISRLVAPGGALILTAITGAQYWLVGDSRFPAYSVEEEGIREALQTLGFFITHSETIFADVTDPEHPDYEGYNGMAMLVATKL